VVTLETLRERRQDILAIAARRGASNVRVFGSVARGDAGPESDVDFLVDFEPGVSLLDHAGLLVDLQGYLQCKVDVGAARMLKPRIRERVMADALPL
jgi:predicted nucleotidyltransferase